MRRRPRLRVLLAAAALALAGAAPARPQPQTFRSGASLVRVDVYATAGGQPVTDLRANEFEVLEDDVPQKIEAFEHVLIQPGAGTQTSSTSASTPTGEHSERADGRSRIFVLFLDTYFTDLGGSRRARYALANFLDRLVGPDDLIGVMTPDMRAADMTLVHRTRSADEMLSTYWFWGQRDSEAVDPVEDQYLSCYPRHLLDRESGSEKYAGVADEMIQRRREKRVIEALSDLTKHLRTVSDARKAVITVSDGWVLFTPNLEMTERGRYRQARPGVGHDGRLSSNVEADDTGASTQRCEQDRVSLALVDDKSTYDALIDDANRSNVSFYPVSVDGLRAFDHDMGFGSGGDALSGERQAAGQRPQSGELGPLRLSTDRAVQGQRVSALQSLAVNTDGLAIAGAADVESGLHRIVDDLSSYYLLGYSSTNPVPDGKFRKIQVRVLRSGVDVRARKGYRAPTREELLRPGVPERTTRAPKTPVDAAMAELKAEKPGSPLRVGAAYASLGPAEAGGDRVHIWAMAEIDPVIARRGEWIGGGTVELSVTARDGKTLARQSATFGGGQHAAAVDFGEVTAAEGEAVVHATARAAGGGRENYAEALHLDSLGAPGRPLVYRRGPETALRYVPTASKDFDRTERLRVDLPLGAPAASPAAELLDRAGTAMSIPVAVTTRIADGLNWVTADLSLAPLATGTYFIRVKPDGAHPESSVVAAFRIVP